MICLCSKLHDAVYVHLELDGITMWPHIIGFPTISALTPTLTGWQSVIFMESYTFCTPEESEVGHLIFYFVKIYNTSKLPCSNFLKHICSSREHSIFRICDR